MGRTIKGKYQNQFENKILKRLAYVEFTQYVEKKLENKKYGEVIRDCLDLLNNYSLFSPQAKEENWSFDLTQKIELELNLYLFYAYFHTRQYQLALNIYKDKLKAEVLEEYLEHEVRNNKGRNFFNALIESFGSHIVMAYSYIIIEKCKQNTKVGSEDYKSLLAMHEEAEIILQSNPHATSIEKNLLALASGALNFVDAQYFIDFYKHTNKGIVLTKIRQEILRLENSKNSWDTSFFANPDVKISLLKQMFTAVIEASQTATLKEALNFSWGNSSFLNAIKNTFSIRRGFFPFNHGQTKSQVFLEDLMKKYGEKHLELVENEARLSIDQDDGRPILKP